MSLEINSHIINSFIIILIASTHITFAQSQDVEERIALLLNKANNYLIIEKDYDKSINISKEVLQICDDNKDINPLIKPIAESIVGISLYEKDSIPNEATYYLNNAYNYFINTDTINAFLATISHYLGLYEVKKKKYHQAIIYISKAARLREKLLGNISIPYASSIHNLAHCHYHIGNYQKAIDFGKEALAIFRENKQNPGICFSLQCIGKSYIKMGNYKDAITNLRESLYIRKSIYGEYDSEYLTMLNDLSISLSFTENYSEAIKVQDYCSELTKNKYGDNSEEYATILYNLSNLHAQLDHLETSIYYLKKCSTIRNSIYGNQSIEYALTISTLALYSSYIGLVEETREYNNTFVEIFMNLTHEEKELNIKIFQSSIDIAYNLGDYEKGIEYGEYFFSIINNISNPNQYMIIEAMLSLSKCYSALKKYQKALDLNEKALKLSDITPNFRDLSKLSLLHVSKFNYLSIGNDTSYLKHAIDEHYLLKKILWEQLHTLTNKDKYEYSKNAFSFYYELINDIWFIKELYPNRLKNIVLLKEIIYEGAILLKDLILNSNKTKNDNNIDNYHISLDDIKNELSPNEVAIEFIDYIDDKFEEETRTYAAIVIRKDWKDPIIFELCSESIITIQKNNKDLVKYTWNRLNSILKPNDTIYFSPSGILNVLPLENLIVEDGKIMSDVYNMHRLSSTRELAIKKEPTKYKKAVLYGGLNYDMTNEAMLTENAKYQTDSTYTLFASRGLLEDSIRGYKWTNLNNTKMEVEYISEQIQQNGISTKIFQGNEGSEESFKALSGKGYNIIHIATHGFFFPEPEAKRKDYFQPIMLSDDLERNYAPADLSLFRTGLVLSGGNRAWQGDSIPDHVEDGILTAHEIKDLDLRGADLVVLSACNTGQGEITSEGVFGLQRAFKMAGAQTIIMSLTEVDDQTTMAMMNKLYSNLMEGQSKHDAFYNAQRYIRSIKPDPKYWRGWIMLD